MRNRIGGLGWLVVGAVVLLVVWSPLASSSSSSSSSSSNVAAGRWHVNLDGAADAQGSTERGLLLLANCTSSTCSQAEYWNADGQRSIVSQLSLHNTSTTTAILQFALTHAAMIQYVRLHIVGPVATGRCTLPHVDPTPPEDGYPLLASAWNQDVVDASSTVRAFTVIIDSHLAARITVDKGKSSSGCVGRLKVYEDYFVSKAHPRPVVADFRSLPLAEQKRLRLLSQQQPIGEELEYDVEILSCSDTYLKFLRVNNDEQWSETFEATIVNRTIQGTVVRTGSSATLAFTGVRWGVLQYGLKERSAADRLSWQESTRLWLSQLVLDGGHPPPQASRVRESEVMTSLEAFGFHRDDSPLQHPADFNVKELHFQHTFPCHADGVTVTRNSHGYLATPANMKPGDKLPAFVAINGHSGSSRLVLYPRDDTIYWYGNALARRNYIVLSIDIGHRNESLFYDDEPNGDNCATGNCVHPAIVCPGYTQSDLPEDGERVWDVMRATDYLLQHPNVDKDRLAITGLSMGGEITTWAGALDPRFRLVVPAGFSPDLDVVFYHGNHACWQWDGANIREYVDTSTLHALIAPKALIIHTGKQDYTYSARNPPFSGDKQVVRKSQSAYIDGEKQNFIHYLHFDEHTWHAGDVPANTSEPAVRFVVVPSVSEPRHANDLSWQVDADTNLAGANHWTIFQWFEKFFS